MRLRAFFIACVLTGAGCLLILPLYRSLILFSMLLLLSLALRCWYSRCELAGKAVSLIWDGEGRWWWQEERGELECRLQGDSYISTRLIILNLQEPVSRRVYSLVLFPSGIGYPLFRRLTVRLKLEGMVEQPGLEGFKKF